MSIKGFSVGGVVQRYDYTALDNLPQGQGVSDDLKAALLQLARKVAYIDDQGQTYYDDLYDALYPEKTLLSITANFGQGQAVIYNTDSLDSLKQYLVVTANYADGGSETVSDYTLSGTLTEGTSIITVSYGGKTVTFTVAVTHATANTSPAITTGAGYRQNNKGKWYAQTGCSVTDAYMRKGTKITFYCPYTEENMPYSQLLMCIFDGTTFIDYFNVTFTSKPNSRDISEFAANSNNIRFMLFDSGIPNCFAYDTDSGDIYFAGVNSPYYGMANINEANET